MASETGVLKVVLPVVGSWVVLKRWTTGRSVWGISEREPMVVVLVVGGWSVLGVWKC